jgi:hypothetical protein
MKSMTLGMGLLVGGLLAGFSALAQDGGHAHPARAGRNEPAGPEPKAAVTLQTTCPVMGGAINTNQYVDHDGKRVYVCCAGCIAKIKEDPAKVVKTLEASGIVLAPADKTDKPAEPKKAAAKGHEGHNH